MGAMDSIDTRLLFQLLKVLSHLYIHLQDRYREQEVLTLYLMSLQYNTRTIFVSLIMILLLIINCYLTSFVEFLVLLKK